MRLDQPKKMLSQLRLNMYIFPLWDYMVPAPCFVTFDETAQIWNEKESSPLWAKLYARSFWMACFLFTCSRISSRTTVISFLPKHFKWSLKKKVPSFINLFESLVLKCALCPSTYIHEQMLHIGVLTFSLQERLHICKMSISIISLLSVSKWHY